MMSDPKYSYQGYAPPIFGMINPKGNQWNINVNEERIYSFRQILHTFSMQDLKKLKHEIKYNDTIYRDVLYGESELTLVKYLNNMAYVSNTYYNIHGTTFTFVKETCEEFLEILEDKFKLETTHLVVAYGYCRRHPRNVPFEIVQLISYYWL